MADYVVIGKLCSFICRYCEHEINNLQETHKEEPLCCGTIFICPHCKRQLEITVIYTSDDKQHSRIIACDSRDNWLIKETKRKAKESNKNKMKATIQTTDSKSIEKVYPDLYKWLSENFNIKQEVHKCKSIYSYEIESFDLKILKTIILLAGQTVVDINFVKNIWQIEIYDGWRE